MANVIPLGKQGWERAEICIISIVEIRIISFFMMKFINDRHCKLKGWMCEGVKQSVNKVLNLKFEIASLHHSVHPCGSQ